MVEVHVRPLQGLFEPTQYYPGDTSHPSGSLGVFFLVLSDEFANRILRVGVLRDQLAQLLEFCGVFALKICSCTDPLVERFGCGNDICVCGVGLLEESEPLLQFLYLNERCGYRVDFSDKMVWLFFRNWFIEHLVAIGHDSALSARVIDVEMGLDNV